MSERARGLWADLRPAFSLSPGCEFVVDVAHGERFPRLWFRPEDHPAARVSLAEELEALAALLKQPPKVPEK